MNAPANQGAALPVAEDAATAHGAALRAIGEPGAWWSGADRLAIARETRAASSGGLCATQTSALSSDATESEHASEDVLPPIAVEAIHRIRNDSGRLTKRWFDGLIDMGLQPEAYVELASVVASTVIVDTFAQGLGQPLTPLPEAVSGAPSLERSDDVVDAGAYVPLAREGRAHILRSLGLVPSASALFFRTFGPSYYMRPNTQFALGRAQVELVASRVSAVNECFY